MCCDFFNPFFNFEYWYINPILCEIFIYMDESNHFVDLGSICIYKKVYVWSLDVRAKMVETNRSDR